MQATEDVKAFADQLLSKSLPVRSVIAIGSVTRPEDYIDGLSDIDIVVVCKKVTKGLREEIGRIAQGVDPVMSTLILDLKGLEREFAELTDIAFLIKGGDAILLDDDTREVIERPLKPTKKTAERLRSYARDTLRQAFEEYEQDNLSKALKHAYHALRHAIRSGAAVKESFPISDSEVLEAAGDRKARALFSLLVSLRHDYENAVKNRSLVTDAIVRSDKIVDSLLGTGNVVPIDDLGRIRYAMVLCYPRPSAKEVRNRIDQLRKLGVDALEFAGKKRVGDFLVLGKGCVSIVAVARKGRRRYALKIRRTDADRASMDHEVEMQKIANSAGVGPKLYGFTKDLILMELIEGTAFPEWIEKEGVRMKGVTRRVLREILEKCRRLDSAGLDHGELSRAPKHIIIDDKGRARIVDFETSSVMRRVSNITSIAQYLFIKGTIPKTVHKIVGRVKRSEVINALRAYKEKRTEENFDRIVRTCSLLVTKRP